MEKYYTPEIEEFHVRFELDVFEMPFKFGATEKDRTWNKGSLDTDRHFQERNWTFIEDYIKKDNIRVKHLDREDIESLEYEADKDWVEKDRQLYHKVVSYRGEDKVCSVLCVPKTNWIVIFMNTEGFGSYVIELPENKLTVTGSTLFCGEIRNLSEFKRILKQIKV